MVDQRLVDYIRDNMQGGYSADYLVDALVQQGWSINDIHEAINIVQGYSMPQEQPGMQPPAAQAAAKPAQQAGPRHRPAGVTIICVLGFLASVLMLLAGILIVFLGQFFGQTIGSLPLGNEAFPFLGNETGFVGMEEIGLFFGSSFGFLGMMFIALAIVDFVGFYMLWKMKKAGWILVTAVGIIMIILYALNFSINNMILIVPSAVIIGYLLIKRKLFA